MWAPSQPQLVSRPGFTIVELLIVVAIIAVLATITIVGYNGFQKRARVAAVSGGITQTKKSLAVYQLNNSGLLPATLSEAGLTNTEVVLEYTRDTATAPFTFCVTGTLKDTSRYIDTNSDPKDGMCNGHVGAGASSGGSTANETWTGTDGAAWPSGWQTSTSATTNTSADILSNRGRLRAENSNAWTRAVYTTPTSTTTQGYTVDVRLLNAVQYANGTIFMTISGTAGTDYAPNTGNTLEIVMGDGTISATELARYVNGSRTSTAYASAPAAITDLSQFTIRFERTASVTRFKLWAIGATEPAAWTASWNDTTAITAGKPMFTTRTNSTVGLSVTYDDLTLYTP